ncbi:hypothetical protein WJ972_04020 [Achromobacter insuavis]
MPLASPGSLMFLAAALLWPPATRRWALLPLAAAYAWAWTQGGIGPWRWPGPRCWRWPPCWFDPSWRRPPAPPAMRCS